MDAGVPAGTPDLVVDVATTRISEIRFLPLLLSPEQLYLRARAQQRLELAQRNADDAAEELRAAQQHLMEVQREAAQEEIEEQIVPAFRQLI